MADPLLSVAAAIIWLTFVSSAALKLIRFSEWRSVLRVYDLPAPIESPISIAVPVVELGVPILLLLGEVAAAGALSTALLAGFCAALLRARSKTGDRVPCGCFGRKESRDYRILLLRNVALLVPSLLVLLLARGQGATLPSTEQMLPAALAVAGVLMLGWMSVQVLSALRHKGSR